LIWFHILDLISYTQSDFIYSIWFHILDLIAYTRSLIPDLLYPISYTRSHIPQLLYPISYTRSHILILMSKTYLWRSFGFLWLPMASFGVPLAFLWHSLEFPWPYPLKQHFKLTLLISPCCLCSSWDKTRIKLTKICFNLFFKYWNSSNWIDLFHNDDDEDGEQNKFDIWNLWHTLRNAKDVYEVLILRFTVH
jgi:hypothetical protein